MPSMRLHRTVTPISRPKWRVASLLAGVAATALATAWISGCSVVYDLSTEQCTSDAECNDLGGVFQGLACINNLCQEPPLTGCQSNAQCMDDFGSGLQPYACINRDCVKLLTTECPLILPQTGELWRENLRTNDPAPLILAGTGQFDDSAQLDIFAMNYELALTELAEKRVDIGGRKVVMLGCNAQYDSTDQLDEMMTHLADEVKVPGMVATLTADNLQRAFTEKGDATNMFFMSAFESDPTLATLPDRGLIWHIGPATDVLARVYGPLLTRILTHLGVTTGVKVATVVTSDYSFLTNMAPTLRASPAEYGLFFNGVSYSENNTAGNHLALSLPTDPEASLATQVSDLLELRPTVIISLADSQFVRRLVPAIESGWPDDGTPRPFYVLSPYNYNDPAVLNLIASTPSLSTRIAGVNAAAAADASAYEDYLARFQFAFPEVTDFRGYENIYDAVYYLLYSAAGAGQLLENGSNLVSGMNRLLNGSTVFEVGPTDLPQATTALAVGGSIQLNGTLGPPDFNQFNGTREESVGSVYCVDSSGFHADVLRYVENADPTAATLTGTFPCITGF